MYLELKIRVLSGVFKLLVGVGMFWMIFFKIWLMLILVLVEMLMVLLVFKLILFLICFLVFFGLVDGRLILLMIGRIFRLLLIVR